MALIPEADAANIKTACRVEEDGDVPPAVERAYWEYKWARDVLDASLLGADEIAVIIFLSGYSKGRCFRPEQPPPSYEELIRAGTILEDSLVGVSWRGGHQKYGLFKGYDRGRDKIVIQFEDKAETTELPLARVLSIKEPLRKEA